LLSTPISSRLNELECCIRIADDFNEALAGTRVDGVFKLGFKTEENVLLLATEFDF
jgi:hypothetical protein